MNKIREFTYTHKNIFAPARVLARKLCYLGGNRRFREDKKRLEAFRGVHKGERCFIVATGPSLTIEDLDLLKGETCFSVNGCIRLFDRTDWRPTYYGLTDRRVFDGLKDELDVSKLNTVFFADSIALSPAKNAFRFLLDETPIDYEQTVWQRLFRLPAARFEADAAKKRVSSGGTVVYAMLQLAVFMGFSEICLLGVDCNYTGPVQHALNTEKTRRIGEKTAKRTGDRMLEAFEIAARAQKKYGFTVYNATRGGMLEAFERRPLESLLKG